MVNKLSLIVLFFVIIAPTSTIPLVYAEKQSPADVNDLRQMIEEKNKELQDLQFERNRLEAKLEEINKESNSLRKEINRIDYQINQLNFSIKANRLIIEKLSLEAESLQEEIQKTQEEINQKKKAIGQLFVKLQQADNESLLVIFLKNDSLSDSVSEMQSIMALSGNLANNVTQLRGLQKTLAKKVEELSKNKRQKEIEQGVLLNRQKIIKEQKEEKQYLLAQTENQEKIYAQKIAELDKKQEEISRIIEEIEHELRASFDPTLLPLKRPGVLSFPLEDILVTQCYGETKFAERAYRTKYHTGTDFRAPLGTPVFAAENGKVTAVDNNDRGVARWQRYQYGKYIMIEHNNNLSTLYAHLASQVVKKGDAVKKGDLIGYSGNTGYSTGPHLHFGVYWAPSVQYKNISPAAGLVPVGVTINPVDYLPQESNVGNCK